jgi:hypothetical protein
MTINRPNVEINKTAVIKIANLFEPVLSPYLLQLLAITIGIGKKIYKKENKHWPI